MSFFKGKSKLFDPSKGAAGRMGEGTYWFPWFRRVVGVKWGEDGTSELKMAWRIPGRLRCFWHILCGNPVMYRMKLTSGISLASDCENALLFDNHFDFTGHG